MRVSLCTVFFMELRPLGLERTAASTSDLQLHTSARPIANKCRESSEDRSRSRWRQIIITRSSRGNRKVKRKWPCGNMNVKMRREPCVLFHFGNTAIELWYQVGAPTVSKHINNWRMNSTLDFACNVAWTWTSSTWKLRPLALNRPLEMSDQLRFAWQIIETYFRRLLLSLRRRSPKVSDCPPANRERELGLDRRETG